MDNEKRESILRELKHAYAGELETVQNYLANSVDLDGVRAEEIKKSLAADIQEELGHAQMLAKRIKVLEGRVPGSLELDRNQRSQQPPEDSTDVITVSARQPLYYFIGGRINSPGQKSYQQGITLIQAILAAGGLTRAQDTVEISREEPDGRLTTTKYALKEIKSGKIPDPRLQPGDRIQVGQ